MLVYLSSCETFLGNIHAWVDVLHKPIKAFAFQSFPQLYPGTDITIVFLK